MSDLGKARIRATAIGFLLLAGMAVMPRNANAAQVPSDQDYLRGTPRCEYRNNERQHPVLCAALADLYRARQSLTKGDEVRQDRLNHNSGDSRQDQISYQQRMRAIQEVDKAIAETRAAILSDPK